MTEPDPPRQLVFDLPARKALGREDFFVSPANATALAQLDGWRDWAGGRLILQGPRRAGKSHLVALWSHESGAASLRGPEITTDAVPHLARGPLAIEDWDRLPGDETALFHLLNLAAEHGSPILLTGATTPARWSVRLPDLASRLQAAPVARLEPPDDALLQAVLVKHFADRQIDVRPALIGFLATRIDRSFAAAAEIVDRLDRAALERKEPVTRRLASRILDLPLAPGR